mmetsp:Transcript_13449/g.40783  ORF Transcript_13449/g.40783 Transcript_13449/m.40783 type:complete len:1353 (+) Transcript_13449:3-4061(+)
MGAAESLVRPPIEERAAELPALMRRRRQLRSQLAALCAIPPAPAVLAKTSATSAASLSAAASAAASPIAMRALVLDDNADAQSGSIAMHSDTSLGSGADDGSDRRSCVDSSWSTNSAPGFPGERHGEVGGSLAAARRLWEHSMRQVELERGISSLDLQIERLLRKAQAGIPFEERVALLPELPSLISELEAEASAAAESPNTDDGIGRCARRRIGAAARALLTEAGNSGCATTREEEGSCSPPLRRGRGALPCAAGCRSSTQRSLLHSLQLLDLSPSLADLSIACGSAALDPTEGEAECAAECTFFMPPASSAAGAAAASTNSVAATSTNTPCHHCCQRHMAMTPSLQCYDPVPAPTAAPIAATDDCATSGAVCPLDSYSIDAQFEGEACSLRVWRLASAASAAVSLSALRSRALCAAPSLLGVLHCWVELATPDVNSWLGVLCAASGVDAATPAGCMGSWLLCVHVGIREGSTISPVPRLEEPRSPPQLCGAAALRAGCLELVQALASIHRQGLSCAGDIGLRDVHAVPIAHTPAVHVATSGNGVGTPPTSPAAVGTPPGPLSPHQHVLSSWSGNPVAVPALSPLCAQRIPSEGPQSPGTPRNLPPPAMRLFLGCLRASPSIEGGFAADVAALGNVLQQLLDTSEIDATNEGDCAGATALKAGDVPKSFADVTTDVSALTAPLKALISTMCDTCAMKRPPASILATHPYFNAHAGSESAEPSTGSAEAQAMAVWAAGWAVRAEAAETLPPLRVVLPWGPIPGEVTAVATNARKVMQDDGDDAVVEVTATPQASGGRRGNNATCTLVETMLALPSLLASAGTGVKSSAQRQLAPFRPFTLVLQPTAPHHPGAMPERRREVSLSAVLDVFWRRLLLYHSRRAPDAAVFDSGSSVTDRSSATSPGRPAGTAAQGGGATIETAPVLLELPLPTDSLGPIAALPPPLPLPPTNSYFGDEGAGCPVARGGGDAMALSSGAPVDPAHPSLTAQRELGQLMLVCLANGIPLPSWLCSSTYRSMLGHGATSSLSDLAAARPQLATRYALFLASIGADADWPDSEEPPLPAGPRIIRPMPAVPPPDADVLSLSADVANLSVEGSPVRPEAPPANIEHGSSTLGRAPWSGDSGGPVAISTASPKLQAVLKSVAWRLHGCRAIATDALVAGFHAQMPAMIAAEVAKASCEALMLVGAARKPLSAWELERRLVFESWPDNALTPRMLIDLLRSESDDFRRRFLLLITGRLALPPLLPESWEGAAAARHTGSLSANGRRTNPGRGGGGLPRGAVAPSMLVIRYQMPPAGSPPPPRVLRSAWVMLLAEQPSAAALRTSVEIAIRRAPEGRWADDDCWLVPRARAAL